jgi:DNA-binding response OmpR family regulator
MGGDAVRLEDVPWSARVLVAIEDPGLRVQVEETLRGDGHEVVAVEDGVALFESLSQPDVHLRVDLVVADVELSGFTGLEVLGLTGDTPQRPPVLLISAEVDLALRRAARHFGAASIVSRRFDVDELRLLVGALLRPALRKSALPAAA